MNFLKIMSNWFGLNNGKFIGETPVYVNKDKGAGMSPIPQPTVMSWIQNAPFVLITSPNFELKDMLPQIKEKLIEYLTRVGLPIPSEINSI